MSKSLESILQELQENGRQEKTATEQSKQEVIAQLAQHRRGLFALITRLTVASFSLLAFVVLSQMIIRFFNQNYTGVSDTVINVLAVGVFAELVGVVGIVAKLLWQK